MAPVTLNRNLVLEEAQRTPDGAGGFAVTWVVLGALWAAIDAGSGRAAAGEAVSLSRTRFRIVVRAAWRAVAPQARAPVPRGRAHLPHPVGGRT